MCNDTINAKACLQIKIYKSHAEEQIIAILTIIPRVTDTRGEDNL